MLPVSTGSAIAVAFLSHTAIILKTSGAGGEGSCCAPAIPCESTTAFQLPKLAPSPATAILSDNQALVQQRGHQGTAMAELVTHTRHRVPGLGSRQTVRWPRAPQPITPCRLHRERLLSCRAASTSNSSGNQSKEAGSTAEAFSKAAGRRYALLAPDLPELQY